MGIIKVLMKCHFSALLERMCTCVIEYSGHDGAVLEDGVCGSDVFKVALFKQRVLEGHGLQIDLIEPGGTSAKQQAD